MTKYKLAPIDTHIVGEIFFGDVNTCETVEVVDVEELKQDPLEEKPQYPEHQEYVRYREGWNDCLDHLTTNGYKIVKVCDD